jgi:hypothetical protein
MEKRGDINPAYTPPDWIPGDCEQLQNSKDASTDKALKQLEKHSAKTLSDHVAGVIATTAPLLSRASVVSRRLDK